MLEVRDLRFAYPEATIRAHFTVREGGCAALMAPSGAGKTTVLNLIAGFLRPHRGEICFAGRNLLGLAPADRPLTYLFQGHNLFPHLSVRQNLAIGLHPGMHTTVQQDAAIDRALARVSLENFAHRKPGSLSGGQQQRAALARCMLRDRPLLLLDEPFTGLDQALRDEMLALLLDCQRHHPLTVLLTTHQSQDATALAAEVVQL